MSPPITITDVEAAAARLRGVATRTPVLTSRTLDTMSGGRLFLKAESFQRGGAFKIRGAYNKISSLPGEVRARGVAAFSSGNHAQAVAIAAGLLGTHAVIVMPEDTPAPKLAATREYGAEIVTYDRYTQSREELGAALAAERRLTLIPPYDDPLVMAGQGTVALELLDQAGPLDLLVVPVGGGGLIAGCATAAKALQPAITVIGVEPETGDDTRRSLAQGERVRIPVPRTIADGQQAEIPGALTFEVNRRLVDEVAVVNDDDIIRTLRLLLERLKIVVEPSGASALAAVLAGAVPVAGRRVGVVLSGGNIDLLRLCTWLGPSAAADTRTEPAR